VLALRILEIIFPVFAVAGAGYLYGRWKKPDMTFANQLNMDVFVPALIFSVLSARTFEFASYLTLALGALLVVLGSGLLALPVARLMGISARTFVPPMMFTNSGNLGLPLAVLAFGPPALAAAVVVFLVENVLHFTLGSYLMDPKAGVLRILKIPIIQATLAGLLFSFADLTMPTAIALPIEMLGQVSIPLLLFALGVRLTDIEFSEWHIGLLGAIVCPVSGILVALLVLQVLPLPQSQIGMLLVFGALPPAVLNFIIAENYRQEPAKVASIVMIGNLAAVVSIPAVLFFALP